MEFGAERPEGVKRDRGVDEDVSPTSAALARLLKPSSIAIVGLSDNSGFADLVRPTLDSAAEVFFVNPRYETVLGRPTAPTLTSLDRPVDAVISFMSAERRPTWSRKRPASMSAA